MTPFRVRIGELAKEAHEAVSFSGTQEGEVAAIESVILRAIEELLTREPSHTMLNLGWLERYKSTEQIYCAMSAQLLKEAKGE